MNLPADEAEQRLVARARQGDRQAFRTLVDRFQDEIAATVVALLGPGPEVDDVVQDTFIRFYEALDDFRGEAKVSTYLKRIAVNRALDVLRRRKRNLARFLRRDAADPGRLEGTLHADTEVEEEDAVEQRERQVLVYRALDRLSPKHRAVVVLRLIEGYSTAETAAMLGIPYGTVLSRLSRALEKLRNDLAPYFSGTLPGDRAENQSQGHEQA
ncbi:sigma-70 family RNA polymerase sigma factor [Rhodocaloribacter litoris]|uniref:RNA polymerase sigma factor n=1 Tax=Rhodocaloribacter litoris TaxID=2558931 RepID=UPI00141F23DA|nr:sigma-70 family RNA polymerase sigma factor [Rhodocaloribacter litoris]QXD15050.1 sigma-70 family RNA polymerase sigma factor [Rhodocaloribacter litoris]